MRSITEFTKNEILYYFDNVSLTESKLKYIELRYTGEYRLYIDIIIILPDGSERRIISRDFPSYYQFDNVYLSINTAESENPIRIAQISKLEFLNLMGLSEKVCFNLNFSEAEPYTTYYMYRWNGLRAVPVKIDSIRIELFSGYIIELSWAGKKVERGKNIFGVWEPSVWDKLLSDYGIYRTKENCEEDNEIIIRRFNE